MECSEITLQDLIGRFHLSDELLGSNPSDEYLWNVSKIIDDHEVLGHELGIPLPEMSVIASEKNVQLQRSAMLRKWKQRSAWKATYRKLIEAFLKCSRADLAQKACEMLPKRKCTHRL